MALHLNPKKVYFENGSFSMFSGGMTLVKINDAIVRNFLTKSVANSFNNYF